MPEGDTIFRAARTLDRALAGKIVTRFDTVLPQLSRASENAPVTGRTVESVIAAGKHQLMRFSGGLTLRTHMRMNGSWHIYRPGERWQRPASDMRVVVGVVDFVAVGFNVPIAELLTERALARQPDLRALGPDLLSDAFDETEALRRMRDRAGEEIAAVLLDQGVIAGAGNIYKSEVLFACGVSPFESIRALGDDQLLALVRTARKLLAINVAETAGAGIVTYAGFRRTTRRADPAERLWVYGRAGKPCRKCGTAIAYVKHGTDGRSTYWCPTCQPAPGR